MPVPDLPAPELPVPEVPVAELPAPELPVPEVPVPEFPVPELPAACANVETGKASAAVSASAEERIMVFIVSKSWPAKKTAVRPSPELSAPTFLPEK